jgi:hypothetical protein
MARALNIVIVHGVGWGEGGKHYARPLIQNIYSEFGRAVKRLNLRDVVKSDSRASRALRFEVVYWSPITQDSQNALLSLMGFGGLWPLRNLNVAFQVRKQLVGLLGDVVAYESGGTNRVYCAIHGRMGESIEALSTASASERGDDGCAPLTMIGHSLGSVIASDFVWDHTKHNPARYRLDEFHLRLQNMFTLGSPLGLYALRNNPSADKRTLAESLDSPVACQPDGGMWLNAYDPQDPVGFPLKPIRSYDAAGVIDCTVRAGNWLTTWSPVSHVGYWRSQEVAHLIARKLALDWAALNSERFAERYPKAVQALRRELERRK